MPDHDSGQSAAVPGPPHRRTGLVVAAAVLGALALGGGGFLAGAALGQGMNGNDVAEVSVDQARDASEAPQPTGAAWNGGNAGDDGAAGANGANGTNGANGAHSGAGNGVEPGTSGNADAGRTGNAAEPGTPGNADAAGRATANLAESGAPDAGKGREAYAVRGDVVEIAGENVLVCATGDGFGVSHLGATPAAGADAEATRTGGEPMCADASGVAGALMSEQQGGDLLSAERNVTVGGREYRCLPVADKVLRCTADDGALITLWSAAP